jgi:hypothetical protein
MRVRVRVDRGRRREFRGSRTLTTLVYVIVERGQCVEIRIRRAVGLRFL